MAMDNRHKLVVPLRSRVEVSGGLVVRLQRIFVPDHFIKTVKQQGLMVKPAAACGVSPELARAGVIDGQQSNNKAPLIYASR